MSFLLLAILVFLLSRYVPITCQKRSECPGHFLRVFERLLSCLKFLLEFLIHSLKQFSFWNHIVFWILPLEIGEKFKVILEELKQG